MAHSAKLAATRKEAQCPTCDTPLDFAFCPNCGEERFSDREFGVRHLLAEVLEGFTHADHKALQTIKLLLTKPGSLTVAFMRGRRKHLLGPVQLFLLINLVFFLSQPSKGGGPFTPVLGIQKIEPYRNIAIPMIDHANARSGMAPAEFEKEFDHRVHLNAKSMVIIIVPMFAACFALLELRKRAFLVQHFVFSLHLMAFILLYFSLVLVGFHLLVAGNFLPRGDYEMLFTWTSYGIVAFYSWRALRRAYSNHTAVALLLAVIFTAAFQYVLYAYRFIMLAITLRSM